MADGGLRLVDSHAHLQTHAFADDGEEVLAAAYAAGVERVLVPGFDLPTTRAGIAFARRHGLRTTAGFHPHVAGQVDERAWSELRELAFDPFVAGVGETGLDYDRGFSSPEDQHANLRRHIALAFELAQPLTLHCRSRPGRRDAQDDLLDLLREGGAGSPQWRTRFGSRPPGVLHSFSGPVDYAETALEMGFCIAFGGLVFRGGEEVSAEVARLTPLDRVLLETDSPYLAPRGVRDRRNVPANVAVTAGWLLEQRGDRPGALGTALVANFDRLVDASDPVR
jgi:TatD DNase family protein